MADEAEKTNEVPVAEGNAPVSKSKRDEYNEYLKSRYAGETPDEDEEGFYDRVLKNQRGGDEAQQRFAEALNKEPELAQVLSDVISGKRGAAAALVRYFGRDMLNAEEGSPEYEEITKSEDERMQELESRKASDEEYNKNLEASQEALTSFASQHNINIDDFLGDVYDKILDPIFSGNYTPEVLDVLFKGLNYDADIEESFNAGTVKGKNTNIEKMKKESVGDGQPSLSNAAPVVRPRNTPKSALSDIKTGSVWDK